MADKSFLLDWSDMALSRLRGETKSYINKVFTVATPYSRIHSAEEFDTLADSFERHAQFLRQYADEMRANREKSDGRAA